MVVDWLRREMNNMRRFVREKCYMWEFLELLSEGPGIESKRVFFVLWWWLVCAQGRMADQAAAKTVP